MYEEQQPCSSQTRSLLGWSMSAINALVGDHLRAERNGLATEMAFYAHARPIPLTCDGLVAAHPKPTGKLVVLVHGLACNEGIWAYRDPSCGPHATSYGARLRSDLGYTPFFVRYNTGLSVTESGEHLSALLDALLACYPVPVDEVVLVGHSMGGLVIQAAAHAGSRSQARWHPKVREVIYLGTPHEGAPLARLSHTATAVLQAVPNPITRLIGKIFDWRSVGLKDLRGGERGRAEHGRPEDALRSAWTARTRHHLVVGTLTADPEHPVTVLLGDGLVPLPRYYSRSVRGKEKGSYDSEGVCVFPGTHHIQLPRDPSVYEQIRSWCGTP